MSRTVTLRVLDGADRGRIYEHIETPITIGREDGNTIQLNDERVSRYHVKIQDDNSNLVLTDLESTNGTKVNGEEIQLRILRVGDMISVGRSTLLYGSRREIAERLAGLKQTSEEQVDIEDSRDLFDAALRMNGDGDWQAKLHDLEPPQIPDRLSPGQLAQLSELIEYIHLRVRRLVTSGDIDAKGNRVVFDSPQWQYLLDLQSQLAEYHRNIGHPDHS